MNRVSAATLVLGLGMVVAACSAASGGSSSSPPASIAPTPSAAPATPSPAATPTTSVAPTTPTPAPEPSSTRFDVVLTHATSHAVSVEVIDWSGSVVDASSGTAGDGASVPYDALVATARDASTIELTWVGGPCDTESSLVIDEARQAFTLIQAPCSGDAIGFDRILVLRFDAPIDPTRIEAVLQPGGDSPG